jgi:hypothetical protein
MPRCPTLDAGSSSVMGVQILIPFATFVGTLAVVVVGFLMLHKFAELDDRLVRIGNRLGLRE